MLTLLHYILEKKVQFIKKKFFRKRFKKKILVKTHSDQVTGNRGSISYINICNLLELAFMAQNTNNVTQTFATTGQYSAELVNQKKKYIIT